MYDNDSIIVYTFDSLDFGDATGDEIRTFRLPPGYQGELVGVGVSITEAFVNASGDTTVEVGTIADPDAYGLLNVATAAADADFYDQTDDTDAVMTYAGATQETQIAADSLVALKTVGGAASAGKGIPILTFRIWK